MIGDMFFINGTTNLPVTDKLEGDIWTTIIVPVDKTGGDYPHAILPDIPIVSTPSGTNRWSVNVTDVVINELPSHWSPYIVTVQSKKIPQFWHIRNLPFFQQLMSHLQRFPKQYPKQ